MKMDKDERKKLTDYILEKFENEVELIEFFFSNFLAACLAAEVYEKEVEELMNAGLKKYIKMKRKENNDTA